MFAILFFYMFQKGARKLTIDLPNRNLFGMFWWFGIAYLGYAGMKNGYKSGRFVISRIRLHKDGKNVLIETPIHPFAAVKCHINKISRPMKASESFLKNEQVAFMVGLGKTVYPVLVDGNELILPKAMKFQHQDVFKAIFNKKYIITEDDDEVIVE